MRLSDLQLLLVDADQDSLEVLAAFLASEGARVEKALTAADALRAAERRAPAVLVTELELPDLSGTSLLLELHARLGRADLPAVALTAHTSLSVRAEALSAGFHKYLVKPVLLDDVVAAASSVAHGGAADGTSGPLSHTVMGQLLALRDYRTLLAALNGSTAHRFSSIFRFDRDRLSSLWTYDRGDPKNDGFPVEVSLADSYCMYLHQSLAPLVIEDSLADNRLLRHRRRREIRAFCGVPLFRGDGALFGALCHFDHEPRPVTAPVLDLLARVAHRFRVESASSDRSGG